MNPLSFFLVGDSRRRRFFLLVLGISIPILALAVFLLNFFEAKADIAGQSNDRGGITYIYRENSGLEELPKPIGEVVKIYPNSEITYLNAGTDAVGKLTGSIRGFTKDPISNVLNFYGRGKTIVSESATDIEISDKNQTYRVSEESTYDDDPIKGQTKFEIYFY